MKLTFSDKIYQLTRQIPIGKVATYGQLAKLAGNPRAARAVGMLMKRNPDAPHTPCHRVVAADGILTGYSGTGGIVKKQAMLKVEGVKFNGDKIDIKNCLWKNNYLQQIIV